MRFVLDGRELAIAAAPYRVPWALTAGSHRLSIETLEGRRGQTVEFEVVAAR
jgi:hypothetical protein